MAKQTINVGTNPNDGTGDTLRTAGQKINSNFTEVYNTSQAGFDKANAAFNYANTIVSDIQTDPYARTTANAAFVQANTATTNANAANTTAQLAFDKANTATTNASAANTTAQSAFDQANTGNNLAQTAFNQANSANTLAQSGFNQANSANSLAQAAFDQANTAGGASLPLANGTSNIDIALANGSITLTANVFILTLDETNGSIDLPGNVTNSEACSAINFVPNSSGDGYGYSTIQLIPDTNATQDQYIIIDPTAPGHIHVRAGGQQDGSTADLFLGGEYSNFKVPAGSNTPVYITANNSVWQFDDTGLFKVPGAVNFQQNATIPLAAPAVNGVNDRVTLWDFQGGGSGFNYAIGAEGNHIWFTMDVNNGTGGFKFYSRDNEIFKIRDDGALLFTDTTVQNTAFTSTPTLNNLSLNGAVFEKFATIQDATGVVNHNCANGSIFYHTSPDDNFTANLQNLSLSSGRATSITLVIAQGGTAYIANTVQIDGVNQTIKWSANTIPTGNSNAIDIQSFSILNNSGTYTVLGQLSTFG